MRKSVILAACLAFAACGDKTPSPRSVVLAGEVALTKANNIAIGYKNLPRCGLPAAPPICSDPTVVETIQAASKKAYDALTKAQAAADADPTGAKTDTQKALSFANVALAAFTETTQGLPGVR